MGRLEHYPAEIVGLADYLAELSVADHIDNMGRPAESLGMLADRAQTEPGSLTDEDAAVLEFFSLDIEGGEGTSSYAA
jgi:hypothetical protein